MRSLKLLAAAAAIAAAMPALAAPTYTLTDLGLGQANDINNLGQVVGNNFMWSDGVRTNIPTFAGWGGLTYRGINDQGVITGNGVQTSGNFSRGFLLQNGAITSIGDLPGGSNASQAWGVNNNGVAVGRSWNAAGQAAVQWQDGTLSAFGGLPAGLSFGYDINNSDQAAGWVTVGGNSRAAMFADGQVTLLGDLPGGSNTGQARGISDAGHIVGQSSTTNSDGDTVLRAFLWANGVMTDLGDLAGGADSSFAYSVNSAGRAVGSSVDPVGTAATMWFDSQIFSLGSLVTNLGGWRLQVANAINERGQIVGFGTLNGSVRAFLLTPDTDDNVQVPAPAALGLFGLGFVGLAMRRRRQRAA